MDRELSEALIPLSPHLPSAGPKDTVDIGLPPPKVCRTQQLLERKRVLRELRASVEEERATRLRTGKPSRGRGSRVCPCPNPASPLASFLSSEHPLGSRASRVGENLWPLPQAASGQILGPLSGPLPWGHLRAPSPPACGLCHRRGPLGTCVLWQ